MQAMLINWSLAKCSCPSWSANTDESALRIALASLDDCKSSLHWWLGFFTVWVVAGVALELVFVVWEYIEELHDFRRGIVHPPDRPNRLLFALGFFAAGLVALGVGGELYAESKIATVETCIRKGDDALFLLLSKEAGDAANSAKTAHDEADTVGVVADNAQRKADAVSTKADRLNRELGVAKTQLEAVDAKRAELEKSLINLAICNAPRVISNWFLMGGNVFANNEGFDPRQVVPGNPKSYVDSLLPMAGQMVFIEVVPDAEARRAALNIAQTLADAQWNVQKPLRFVDGLADGVSVQPSLPTFTAMEKSAMSPYWHANDVAEKLLEFLHSYNWQAVEGVPLDPQGRIIRDDKVLPAGAIKIQIGLYPASVYVNPPGQKELTSRLEELKRREEQADAARKRRHEEQLATVPPEFRRRVEQANEEWEARVKNARSKGPCQVLNPL